MIAFRAAREAARATALAAATEHLAQPSKRMFGQSSSRIGEASGTHDAIQTPLPEHVDIHVHLVVWQCNGAGIPTTIIVTTSRARWHSWCRSL